MKSLDILRDILTTTKPVSFEEFVTSPDYCNDPSIYKYWIDREKEISENCSELILDGSLGCGKCIESNQRISTNKGYLSGDELLDFYKAGEGFTPVQDLFAEQYDGSFERVSHIYSEHCHFLKITLSNGKVITGTPDHPIISKKYRIYDFYKFKDLSVGDYVLERTNIPFKLHSYSINDLLFWFTDSLETQLPPISTLSKSDAFCIVLSFISRHSLTTITFDQKFKCEYLCQLLDYLSIPFTRKNLSVKISKTFYVNYIDTIICVIQSLPKHLISPRLKFIRSLKGLLKLLPKLDYRDVKIKKIQLCHGKVFDVTVPNTRHFVSSNTINHNTTFANYYLAYKIYKLFLLGSPQAQLGVSYNSDIYCLYFSVSMKMAKMSGFQSLYSVFEHNKWFQQYAPINKELHSSIEFLNKSFYIHYASAFCLDENQYVFTSNGIKRACQVSIHDLLWNGEKFVKIQKIKTFHDEALKINLKEGGHIITSLNHLNVLESGKLKTSEALKPGDRLKVIYNYPHLLFGDDFTYNFKQYLFDFNRPKLFSFCLNTDTSFCLGWFIGRGSVSKTRINFSSSLKDLDVIKRLKSILNTYWRTSKITKSHNNFSFYIKSKTALDLFTSLCLDKYNEKFISDEVFTSNSIIQRSFLRGLFSSCGQLSKHKVSLCLDSLNLINQVQILLRYLNISSEISIKRTDLGKTFYQLSIFDIKSFKSIGFVGSKSDVLELINSSKSKLKYCTVLSKESISSCNLYSFKVVDSLMNVNGLMTHNSHQIGLNVFSFILDEANFRQGVGVGTEEQYEEVTNLYQQLLDRQASRFVSADGTIKALAILISSASYQSSFLEKRKQAIKSNPNSKCITTVTYEVKPEKYSKETFEVFIGAGVIEPCIITSEDQKNKLLSSANILGTGEEDNFFRKVPINLKQFFNTDIITALQNHCGVSTVIKSSFMSNTTYLFKSFTDEITSIFQSESLIASTEDDTELLEYLIPENIVLSNNPHCLFLDLSVQNDVGALCCYRYDGVIDGIERHTRVFSLRILPPNFPAQTSISKVTRFIIGLGQYINIVAFASDQYMSTQVRQDVQQELGLEDIRISIDSSDIPYLHWARGLVEGKIKQTEDMYLTKEAKEAIRDVKRHRIIKSSKSSDDVLQANVGAYYLSDTFGKNQGNLEDLYNSKRLNLVGGKSIDKVLKTLGYNKQEL